jgi:hypothetical protein
MFRLGPTSVTSSSSTRGSLLLMLLMLHGNHQIQSGKDQRDRVHRVRGMTKGPFSKMVNELPARRGTVVVMTV